MREGLEPARLLVKHPWQLKGAVVARSPPQVPVLLGWGLHYGRAWSRGLLKHPLTSGQQAGVACDERANAATKVRADLDVSMVQVGEEGIVT